MTSPSPWKRASSKSGGVEIFCSYAHSDESLCKELFKHLKSLESAGLITAWSDGEISPGSVWSDDIRQAMERSRIILILISIDLLNSAYCTEVEIPFALSRRKLGRAIVIPILLRPVVWRDHPLASLEALPRGALPVTLWPNRDEAFVDIVEQIRVLILKVCELQLQSSAAPEILEETLPSFDLNRQEGHFWVDNSVFGPMRRQGSASNLPRLPQISSANRPPTLLSQRPTRFVQRIRQLNELKQLILAELPTHKPAIVGVRGQAGIGKTVLVGEVARDTEINRSFTDGAIWITLGRKPRPTLDLLKEVGRSLGDLSADYSNEVSATASIANLLDHKSALIILDDVWDPDPIQPFLKAFASTQLTATRSFLLYTTRKKSLLRMTNCREYKLDVLDRDQAELILTEWLENRKLVQRSEAEVIFERCQGHVLALRQIGSLLAQNISDFGEDEGWKAVATVLQHQRSLPKPLETGEPDFDSIMEASLAGLAREIDRERYRDLAVFPDNNRVPLSVLPLYWSTTEAEAQQTVSAWINLCLVDTAENSTVKMHNLQLDFVKVFREAKYLELHSRLVEAFQKHCESDNLTLGPRPNNPYFWKFIVHHLREAGRASDSASILGDPEWLFGKLKECGPADLCIDLETQSGPLSTILLRTIRLAEHILGRDPSQLFFQLYSRLLDHPDAREFTTKISTRMVFRPTRRTLQSPGVLVRRLQGHLSSISSVALNANGTIAVSGSSDKAIIVWDVETGRVRRRLEGHLLEVSAVALTTDESRVVSGSADTTVLVWNLKTGAVVHRLEGHSHRVSSVAISDDDAIAVSASSDRSIIAWNLQTGALLHRFIGHADVITSVSLSSDAKIMVSGSADSTLMVWNVISGDRLGCLRGHNDSVWAVAVTESGDRAVSGSHDKTLMLWDLASCKVLDRFEGHTSHVTSVAISEGSNRVLSASADQTLMFWDLKERSEIRRLHGHSWDVKCVAMSRDAKRAVSGSSDHTMIVWDLTSRHHDRSPKGHSEVVTAVAFVPETNQILSASLDKTIRLTDFTTGRIEQTFEGHLDGVTAACSIPNSCLAISGSRSGSLIVWDITRGTIHKQLPGSTAAISSVAVSPDGVWAVSASSESVLNLWNLQTGQLHRQLEGHTHGVRSVAISADGSCIVSGSSDNTAIVWNAKSGLIEQRLKGHTDWVKAVALTGDSKTIITASSDKTVRIWNPRTGRQEGSLEGHQNPVLSIAITPDGMHVLSGAWDGSIKLWRLRDRHCIGTFTLDAPVSALCVDSRSMVRVVAGDISGVIHTFELKL